MTRLGGFFMALTMSLVSTFALADGFKMGVVDLQKIMQQTPQMKDVQATLEKEFKPRRDKLVAAEANLKGDMEKFKRDSAILSNTQKKDLEKKIISAQQQFERDGQQYQQELTTAQNEAMEGLYKKIRAAITKIATADKYDIIVQKDAAPFSVSALDVTDKVMKILG